MSGAYRDIVVMGASSGGFEALQRIFCELSSDLPASVFVVVHLDPCSESRLPWLLSYPSGLRVKSAQDGESLEKETAYIAVPDRHLLIDRERVRLTFGPRENRARPSVDALFRSAAAFHGSRVIGIILTGHLDDGTAGLAAIKRCGGVAIVQEPSEAAYDSMPRSAIDHVTVDHVVPLEQIPGLISKLVLEPSADSNPPTEDLLREVSMSAGESTTDKMQEAGRLSPYSCPDCGGPMWRIQSEPVDRYRCHTGHAHTARSLAAELNFQTERSLWVALRTMEERTRMLQRLSDEEAGRGRPKNALRLAERADESHRHSQQIRTLLLSLNGGRHARLH